MLGYIIIIMAFIVIVGMFKFFTSCKEEFSSVSEELGEICNYADADKFSEEDTEFIKHLLENGYVFRVDLENDGIGYYTDSKNNISYVVEFAEDGGIFLEKNPKRIFDERDLKDIFGKEYSKHSFFRNVEIDEDFIDQMILLKSEGYHLTLKSTNDGNICWLLQKKNSEGENYYDKEYKLFKNNNKLFCLERV